MTAVALWFVIKIIITIGFVVALSCFLIFTKDGRVMLAWIAGIAAAVGGTVIIGSLIFFTIGSGVIWLLYQVLLMFPFYVLPYFNF